MWPSTGAERELYHFLDLCSNTNSLRLFVNLNSAIQLTKCVAREHLLSLSFFVIIQAFGMTPLRQPKQAALIIKLLLLASLSLSWCAVGAQDERISVDQKLEKILASLESLSNKYDSLIASCGAGQLACCVRPRSGAELDEKPSQPAASSNNEQRQNLPGARENFKRESGEQRDPVLSRPEQIQAGLLHFNKLARDSDSILNPLTNSGKPTVLASLASARQNELEPGENHLLLVGMSAMLDQQLASFRQTLTKMTNRLTEHNYQHSVLTNQLLLVKDECSLSAAYSMNSISNHSLQQVAGTQWCPTSKADDAQETLDAGRQKVPEQQQVSALRSSEASMIVRLLSRELNQLLDERASTAPPSETHQLNLAPPLEAQLVQLGRRLNEIDSVVKQTALLVNKWPTNGPESSGARPCSVAPNRALGESGQITTITYTNEEAPPSMGNKQPQVATSKQQTSRWFSGSKVPNRQPDDLQDSQQQQQRQQQADSVARCQPKTGLVRPTSCRHLRLAGATCTGQYYVFVRGSIRHVYCDMNSDSQDEGGGWTVILRRRDKSLAPAEPSEPAPSAGQAQRNQLLESFRAAQVDFGLDWQNYKSGFGFADQWGEHFIGLELLHQLTNLGQPDELHELQVDMQFAPQQANESLAGAGSRVQNLSLRFGHFRVLAEQSNYTLLLNASHCLASSGRALCEPLANLNGAPFTTFDLLEQRRRPANCTSSSSIGGWWRTEAQVEQLTSSDRCESSFAPTNWIGPSRSARSRRQLFWPSIAEPLRQLVFKMRQRTNRLA